MENSKIRGMFEKGFKRVGRAVVDLGMAYMRWVCFVFLCGAVCTRMRSAYFRLIFTI